MAINNEKMLQSVYDTLFSGYVSPPKGVDTQGSEDPKGVYLCLEWPGKQVLETDVANPWSPTNKDGLISATENFSGMVDIIPQTLPMFTPTGRTISDTYRSVTGANVTPPDPTEAQKAAYAKADAVLWMDAPDFDDAGKPTTVKKPHPMYLAYKKARLAYSNALNAYVKEYLSYDMTKPEDQRKWALLGQGPLEPVNAAMDDWTSAHKTRIEDALATIAQSSNNQSGVVFREAAARLGLLAKKGLTDPTKTWYASYASPANWFAPSAAASWTNATITGKSAISNESSDFQSIKTQASGGWGLWSASGGFSKDTSHKEMHEKTDNLTVSFSYARVDIERPWLNAVLFGIQGWETTAATKNGYSIGTRNQPIDKLFPLLPMSFVAVRNLSITADWDEKDASEIHERMASNASFGWGPFSVSGSYASGSDTVNKKAAFDGRTITNDGLQIIAWISAIVPACPPK